MSAFRCAMVATDVDRLHENVGVGQSPLQRPGVATQATEKPSSVEISVWSKNFRATQVKGKRQKRGS